MDILNRCVGASRAPFATRDHRHVAPERRQLDVSSRSTRNPFILILHAPSGQAFTLDRRHAPCGGFAAPICTAQVDEYLEINRQLDLEQLAGWMPPFAGQVPEWALARIHGDPLPLANHAEMALQGWRAYWLQPGEDGIDSINAALNGPPNTP